MKVWLIQADSLLEIILMLFYVMNEIYITECMTQAREKIFLKT